ncbi:hypothetical protein HMSSN139_58020 [Paenibacillus sp. HMSSN-139]|nr:hypothetical protein HMSSN139_58020 [Paenibacillus sp. HMSSN-139]
MLVLRILNMESVRDSRFNRDRELLYFAVANVINDVAVDSLQCFSFANPKQEREMIAVYTARGGYPQEIAFRAGELMRKVVSTLSGLFGVQAAGGIGRYCEDVLDLAGSYEEAVAGIQGVDLLKLKGNAVIGEADKPAIKETFSFSSRMPILRGALEAGNLNHAKSVMAEFAKSIRTSGFCSIGAADRLLREIVVLMNDTASELGVPADKLPSSGGDRALQALGLRTDVAAFDQFEALLQDLTEYYHEQVRRSMAAGRPFSVEDIKEYIDNHYFEDIKISVFTEKYFLSREYLMKLFKQQYGCGIHEYVQKVRMDKAKELLDDSSLKIQEISEMLGYKDKNYFSKAFRNYYDLSPSEYRQQQEERVKK